MVNDVSGKKEPSAPRSVGRGEKLRAAVLAATLEELSETGYGALTIERVAQRAGVHKTSIYRNWTDREGLVVDALTVLIAEEVPIPDTHAVESDIRELARGFVRWAMSLGGRAVLSVMLSDAAQVPEIAEARRDFYDQRFRTVAPVILRAIERGELPEGTDPTEVLKTLVAPVYFRLMVTGETLSEAVADRAAEVALAAARAGVLVADPETG